MPTNKQRREAARRHLERQLARRVEQEAKRRKVTLITSIIGTIVLIAVIITCIELIGNSDSGKKNPAASSPSPTTSPTPTPTTSTPSATPSTSYPPAKGASVKFDGVTVTGARDLSGVPTVTSHSNKPASALEYKDLVVGKGTAATPTSNVTVQYVGVLYSNGKEFDSSWARGAPTPFPLTGVVPGFTQGIGGTKGVPPMRVGGRRIIIMPGKLAYGANPQAGSGIPKNATLVFVVDLKKVAAATSG